MTISEVLLLLVEDYHPAQLIIIRTLQTMKASHLILLFLMVISEGLLLVEDFSPAQLIIIRTPQTMKVGLLLLEDYYPAQLIMLLQTNQRTDRASIFKKRTDRASIFLLLVVISEGLLLVEDYYPAPLELLLKMLILLMRHVVKINRDDF
jgi:hypothetical protein